MATMKARRRKSVSQAKNIMLRAMDEILDPTPTNIGPIWDHFEAHCAYCDIELDITDRSAHIDHAESGGGNHLGNLVLSCGSCNGDEKREMPWRDFVALKAPSEADAAARVARIEAWQEHHPRTAGPPPPEALRIADEIRALTVQFSTKCDELRAAMKS
jgi:5-methylcytosine-specific restriction endonuclease McrA